jgi:Phospholipase_D-nuclease N-terminal
VITLSFMFFGLLIGVAGTVFWIWMIVECATKEPNQGNEKIVWILVIIFTHWIGALIYFFVRRPQRIAQFGS